MRDPQFIGFIFLLSATVVAAYFYLKRAQRRPPVTKADETAPAESRSASTWTAPASAPPGASGEQQPQSSVERGT